MSVTRSYSLPEDVAKVIDAIPKRERSKFVASTLRKAVQEKSRRKALDALSAITPIHDNDKRSSSELLEEARQKRREELTGGTTGDE